MKKRLREPVNGLTHLVGAVLAFAGLIVLLARATSTGRVDQFVAFGIFGLSLVALYSASALYHLLPLSPPGIARLRRVDHMMIFVLIAGCYTPVCLLVLQGSWRWGLLGLVWGLALWCGAQISVDGWPALALGNAIHGDAVAYRGHDPRSFSGGRA